MSCSISTHVLDTAAGRPAVGVRVELWLDVPSEHSTLADTEYATCIAETVTDDDGRVRLAEDLVPGTYRLIFHPPSPFFRRVELAVALEDGHHHVPLLISPFGCASYRGS